MSSSGAPSLCERKEWKRRERGRGEGGGEGGRGGGERGREGRGVREGEKNRAKGEKNRSLRQNTHVHSFQHSIENKILFMTSHKRIPACLPRKLCIC